MSSELCLHLAGIFFSYSLQVAAAYVAFWFLSGAFNRPGLRFATWMSFLAGSIAYWIVLVSDAAKTVARPGTAPGVASANPVSPLSPLLVPVSWGPAILLASKVLAGIYVVTVFLLAAAAAWRHLRLRLVLRHGRPAGEEVVRVFDTTRSDAGIVRCRLMVLPGIASPATVGWLRPRILLPPVCEDSDLAPRLAGVLHHELAHVARRDYFWTRLSDLICILLFFHPAAWWAKRRLLVERELACDSAVVEAHPEHRADYADSLAYFVRLRMLEERAALGLDFAASASSLGHRVRFILAAPAPLPWWKKLSRTGVGAAILCAFAVVAPALTVSLYFQPSWPALPLSSPPPAAARVVRRASRARRPARTSITPAQSLAGVKMRASLPETPAYSLTSSRVEPESEATTSPVGPAPPLKPATPQTISSVVRSAVGVILSRGGGDHDHDRHFGSQ